MNSEETKKELVQKSPSRRRLIKTLALGSAYTGTQILPNQWAKPVVNSVMTPAHAATSGCSIVSCSGGWILYDDEPDAFQDIFLFTVVELPNCEDRVDPGDITCTMTVGGTPIPEESGQVEECFYICLFYLNTEIDVLDDFVTGSVEIEASFGSGFRCTAEGSSVVVSEDVEIGDGAEICLFPDDL